MKNFPINIYDCKRHSLASSRGLKCHLNSSITCYEIPKKVSNKGRATAEFIPTIRLKSRAAHLAGTPILPTPNIKTFYALLLLKPIQYCNNKITRKTKSIFNR